MSPALIRLLLTSNLDDSNVLLTGETLSSCQHNLSKNDLNLLKIELMKMLQLVHLLLLHNMYILDKVLNYLIIVVARVINWTGSI